jgi:hypothetical protein
MKRNITIFRIDEDLGPIESTYVGLVLKTNSTLDFQLWQGAYTPRAPSDDKYDLRIQYLRDIEAVGQEQLVPFAGGTTSIDDYFSDFISLTTGQEDVSINWFMRAESKVQILYLNDLESAQIFAKRYGLEIFGEKVDVAKKTDFGFGLSPNPKVFSSGAEVLGFK